MLERTETPAITESKTTCEVLCLVLETSDCCGLVEGEGIGDEIEGGAAATVGRIAGAGEGRSFVEAGVDAGAGEGDGEGDGGTEIDGDRDGGLDRVGGGDGDAGPVSSFCSSLRFPANSFGSSMYLQDINTVP